MLLFGVLPLLGCCSYLGGVTPGDLYHTLGPGRFPIPWGYPPCTILFSDGVSPRLVSNATLLWGALQAGLQLVPGIQPISVSFGVWAEVRVFSHYGDADEGKCIWTPHPLGGGVKLARQYPLPKIFHSGFR